MLKSTDIAALASVVLLAACGGTGPGGLEFVGDTRLDSAEVNDDPDSQGTKMCLTDAGHVYVLWLDNRRDSSDPRSDIWLNRSLDRGDSWLQAPVRVNHEDSNVFNAELHCNSRGVFVVWEDDRDGELENHQIYFNKSTNLGETFLDEDILLEVFDVEGNSMSLEPKIIGSTKPGSEDELFVTWYDNLNGAYDILVTSSGDSGETWRDPVRVDSDQPAGSAYSARPKIAVSDDALDVFVVWEDSRDGAADVYFARSVSGGVSWENDDRLDVGDGAGAWNSFEPQICTNGDESVYVVWHDARNGEGRDVFYNYSPDSGADWSSEAERIDSDPAGLNNSLFPVCVAEGSSAHVAWQDNRNDGYDIFYRQIRDGLLDDPEVRLDIGDIEGGANSLGTTIANDRQAVMVAWRDGRSEARQGVSNGFEDLHYQHFGATGFDRETAEVDSDFRVDSWYDGQSFKTDLNIAVLGGEWYAAWTDGRNGSLDVFFRRLALGEAATPPPIDELNGNLN